MIGCASQEKACYGVVPESAWPHRRQSGGWAHHSLS
jgi:hypothetical protein